MNPVDIYTSTGVKFWRHPEQMMSWLMGRGKSVISTHISPEGSCNLNCDFCSVTNRDKYEHLTMDTIMKYITDLIPRGLKAVILTGGGEPTLWPEWNTLVGYLAQYRLKYGLITNGVDLYGKDLHIFDWIRVSINIGVTRRIIIDKKKIKNDCTIGASFIYSGKNKQTGPAYIISQAQRIGAEYIRILPDCLLENLEKAHKEIDHWLHIGPVVDSRWIYQLKQHKTPALLSCPQAYFRPYLSEIDGGTVFPCFSENTLVQTDNGLMNIQDIEIGCNVLSHDGKYHEVTKLYKRKYNGELIKIIPTGYSQFPIILTPNHKIWASKRNGTRFRDK